MGILGLALQFHLYFNHLGKGFSLSLYKYMLLIPSIPKVQSIYSTLTEEGTYIMQK